MAGLAAATAEPSTAEATAQPAMRLRLKGTFIDIDDRDSVQSPRAHSEPRQSSRNNWADWDEEQRYLEKLSSRCGYGLAGSSSQIGDMTPRRQPLQRRSFRDVGSMPTLENQKNGCAGSAVSSTAKPSCSTAAATAANAKSLADYLGRDSRDRDTSPCSQHGAAGSDRGSDIDSNVSSGRDRKHRHGPRSPRGNNARRAFDEHSRADEDCRWWGGTESEPGGRSWREEGERAFSSGVAPDRRPSMPLEKVSELEEGKETFLHQIIGKWRVADGSEVGSVWTIEDGGRACFNGKRFGTEYDIQESTVCSAMGEAVVLMRSDGWTVSLDGGQDKLVWRKEGAGSEIAWTRVSKSNPSEANTDSNGHGDAQRWETKTQLRSKMQASAQQMSDGWKSEDRLSSAMAVIEEIPKRISEDMQRAASYVVDNMQSEVAAMSKQIRGSDWGAQRGSGPEAFADGRRATDKVIKNLEVIPTMVQNLLEARVEKARSKVRHRVQGMMQNLSAIKEEDWQDHGQLVSQMRMITEEVEQIAGEAVRAAAQECHAHATKQLDCALTALRDAGRNDSGADVGAMSEGKAESEGLGERGLAAKTMALSRPRWSDMLENLQGTGETPGWCVTHDLEFWSKSEPNSFTNDTMEQAVAVVQDKDYIPQSFTNQVVADELLRARIRSGGGNRRGATPSGAQSSHDAQRPAPASPGNICNPGSAGHPDLCLRPCLYFAQGNCSNGNECPFCHLPHPKRPVRFDKLHRDSLKKMPFSQFLSIMLPVLKQKARDLDFSDEQRGQLEQLWPLLDAQVLVGIPDEDIIEVLESPLPAAQETHHWLLPTTPRKNEALSTISSNASATGSDRSTRRSSFGGALQAMGFRPLLAMLLSKAPEDHTVLRLGVEEVLSTLHSGAVMMSGMQISVRSESDSWRPTRALASLPEQAEKPAVSKEGQGPAPRLQGNTEQPQRQRRPHFPGGTRSRQRSDHVFRNWSGPASEMAGTSSGSRFR